MNDQLRTRLGAVILALLTLAAIIFAGLNFQRRSRFALPSDGVTWVDSAGGVEAWHVASGSPADRAGIKQGDTLQTVHGVAIHRAIDVTKLLYHAGPWTELRYGMLRDGASIELPLITVPQDNPSSIENYLRITALLYLFIGLFIFVRRWNAPRAVHFYIFCLVSFILYSFHYSGKLNSFDWTIYWGNVVALLLQPALLVHFALVFPERRGALWPKVAAVYSIPAALLFLHVFVATGTLDFWPSPSSQRASRPDRIPLPRRLFSPGRRYLLVELLPRAERRPPPAVEMGHGRHVRRDRSLSGPLHFAASSREDSPHRG